MKGKPIDQLVYEQLFPKPKPTDAPNFAVFQQQRLIPEVRQEVHAYYGHLDTPEAKYPGLDYCNKIHRIRLSRWKYHQRLFKAFDALRLTPNEIASLTKWEGTKWAKDRYEKEQGIQIRDTTSDEFEDWVPPHERRARAPPAYVQGSSENDMESVEGTTMAEDSDEELASVGADLNERLRERVAARNVSGDLSMTLDEEWEQWLKNAIETGELPDLAEQITQVRGSIPPRVPGEGTLSPFTPGMLTSAMLAAARNDNWGEIPDVLRPMIRQVLVMERRILPPPLNVVAPTTSATLDRPPTESNNQPPQPRRRPIGRPRRAPQYASLRANRITSTPVLPHREGFSSDDFIRNPESARRAGMEALLSPTAFHRWDADRTRSSSSPRPTSD